MQRKCNKNCKKTLKYVVVFVDVFENIREYWYWKNWRILLNDIVVSAHQ